MNIVLTGFMGTGKTAVAKLLATKLGWRYIDTDDLIEEEAQMKIKDIFSSFSEEYFRNLETKIVKQVSQFNKCIIACGGGVVLREENMVYLEQNGIVICLTATPEVIYQRIKDTHIRPLLEKPDPLNEIRNLLSFRKPYYQRCNMMIDTSNITIEKVVNDILSFVGDKIYA